MEINYGIFCEVFGKDFFINNKNNNGIFNFSFYNEDNLFFLKFQNKTNDTIVIKSAAFDFFIPAGNLILEHGWLQCSDAVYKNKNHFTKKNLLFLKRNQNPFSFRKDYGYIKKSIVSEWFTLIKGNTNYLIGAITTKNQFTQIYIKEENNYLRIRVTCQFDEKKLEKGDFFISEKIAFLKGNETEIKREFNYLIKKNMLVKKKPKPIAGVCCAYYWNGKTVDEKICHSQLDAIINKRIKIDYFQIDDGYTIAGDWLNYKKKFPNGFKDIIAKCKKNNIKCGIWIAPFIAARKSQLFKSHPDWFLKNNNKYIGLEVSPLNFLPDLDFKVLDPTNLRALEYLKKVLGHFKKLGFELIKIDFLSSIALVNYENATRAEVFRKSMEFIRKCLGNKIYILSGISQLSPLIGIADSARLGLDTLLPQIPKIPILNEIGNNMLRQNIRTCEERKYFDFWAMDPDAVVLRHGLSNELINNHIKFIKENKTSFWIGDDIRKLSKNQVKLLKSVH